MSEQLSKVRVYMEKMIELRNKRMQSLLDEESESDMVGELDRVWREMSVEEREISERLWDRVIKFGPNNLPRL